MTTRLSNIKKRFPPPLVGHQQPPSTSTTGSQTKQAAPPSRTSNGSADPFLRHQYSASATDAIAGAIAQNWNTRDPACDITMSTGGFVIDESSPPAPAFSQPVMIAPRLRVQSSV